MCTMLAMAVVNNHEENSSNGHASPDSEDVLTRLRQIQRTLRECHFRLDRTDRWADSLLGKKGNQEEWTSNGISMYEGHVNGIGSERHSKLEEGGRRLVEGFVVKEGVCKESIIASEVVEELVPEWESDLETMCNTEDVKPTEVRTVEESDKADNHSRKYISRLPRQHSIDFADEDTVDDYFGSEDDTDRQSEEEEIVTVLQVSCNGVPYNDNEKHVDTHFSERESPDLVKECKDQVQQTEPEANSSDSGAIIHLKFVEETLEHLRQHFSVLKFSLNHTKKEDWKSDPGNTGSWESLDQEVSAVTKMPPFPFCVEDPTKSTLPNLNPQSNERLEPEFLDSMREGNLLRTRVRNEVDNKDQMPLSKSFYQNHFRIILPILIVFFLLLMFLLLACYLLLVVPFVVVSFRHMEGTITF